MKKLSYLLIPLLLGIIYIIDNQLVPTKRSEIASTLLGNKMYIAGGINFWWSNDHFEVYDLTQNTWERLPNLPHSLNHIGLAAHEGKVYLSGGFFNARQTKFSKKLYVYDVVKKEWSELSEMPAPRAAHFMIQRGDYLHLFGGRNHQAVWSYHLKTNKWTTDFIAPIPEKRDHISLLQTDQKLYLVGGRQSGVVKGACWEYDFTTNNWTTFATLPTPRGGQSACLQHQQIHIIGGEDLQASKTYDRHDIFDLSTQKWSVGTSLKTARHGFVSELVGNRWYIFGGGKKAGVKTLYSTTADLEIMELK